MTIGNDENLQLCLCCHSICPQARTHCKFCGTKVYIRRPLSLQKCWALTLLATILYIPANILPIMSVEQFGKGQPDTILSGVISLMNNGMYSVAFLVFLFSIVVPIFKISGLLILLLAAKNPYGNIQYYIKLYRFLEWIGRWSMLDIFIIGLLVSLVRFGFFGTVEVQAGALAFASVVIVTMAANMQFDPRILWDRIHKN